MVRGSSCSLIRIVSITSVSMGFNKYRDSRECTASTEDPHLRASSFLECSLLVISLMDKSSQLS